MPLHPSLNMNNVYKNIRVFKNVYKNIMEFKDVYKSGRVFKSHLEAQEAPESNSAVMLFSSSVSPETLRREWVDSNYKIQE